LKANSAGLNSTDRNRSVSENLKGVTGINSRTATVRGAKEIALERGRSSSAKKRKNRVTGWDRFINLKGED